MKFIPAKRAVFLMGALWLVAAGGRAFHPPSHERLENFDRRGDKPAAAKTVTPAKLAAIQRLRSLVPDARVDRGESPVSPIWVRSVRGFLSASDGQGRGVTTAIAQSHAPDDPLRGVKAFLDEHQALFGHGSGALAKARVVRDFTMPGAVTRTVIWEQDFEGIPIFEGRLLAHTVKQGEVLALSGRFQPDPERASRARTKDRASLLTAPPLSAAEAVTLASRTLNEPVETESVTSLDKSALDDPRRKQSFRAGALRGRAQAALTWLPLNDDEMTLCWEVILPRRTGGETFRVLIDAQTGETWLRHGLTKYLTDATYRVWTGDSPTPLSPAWPGPNTNQPPVVPRTLVTLGALHTNASPLGWISEGMNETLGNNVAAHLDLDDDDLPDLPRPQGAPARVFDFPVDLAQPPAASRDAAVVNLFYWCNWAHDRLYELGFTEAAGNFQADNLGRGGADGDAVQADGQDGAGFNNANFTTFTDGTPPRMQMFTWLSPSPDRDGDFDAEVILHEYAHGLTERLVGGGGTLLSSQSAGLAEGWSDYYALSLMSEPADDVDGTYAIGAYVALLYRSIRDNYYFGIRRFPYCTDLAKNPLTFKDIDPLQAAAHSGVPRSPFVVVGSEPHAQGEVWCSVLWDARARLVRRLGWTNGSQLMLQLVTDALPLTPANPNFLQARDALFQADLARTGGENCRDFWTAFARRGMGADAASPSSSTTIGVIEAFNVPDDFCPPLLVVSLNVTNSAGVLRWPAVPGFTYRIEFKNALGDAAWTALGTATATNNVGVLEDSAITSTQRFYRIVVP